MRILSILLILAACGEEPVVEERAAGLSAPCALNGADAFDQSCTVQRQAIAGGTLLTLIAPDGGFRRVSVGANGSGVTAGDGAEPATLATGAAGQIEIRIAGDRYRLPAAS